MSHCRHFVWVLLVCFVSSVQAQSDAPVNPLTQEAYLEPTANVIRTEIAATATAFPLTPEQTDDVLGVAFALSIGSMVFVLALVGIGFWLSSRRNNHEPD